jgi:hypothetical protein
LGLCLAGPGQLALGVLFGMNYFATLHEICEEEDKN